MADEVEWPLTVTDMFDYLDFEYSEMFVRSIDDEKVRGRARIRQLTAKYQPKFDLSKVLEYCTFDETDQKFIVESDFSEYEKELDAIEWDDRLAQLWTHLVDSTDPVPLHTEIDDQLGGRYQNFISERSSGAEQSAAGGAAVAGAGKAPAASWEKEPLIAVDALVGDDFGFDWKTSEIEGTLNRLADVSLKNAKESYDDLEGEVQKYTAAQSFTKDNELATVGSSKVSFGVVKQPHANPVYTLLIDLQASDIEQRNFDIAREKLADKGGRVPYTRCGDLIVLGRAEQGDDILSAVRWAKWLSGEEYQLGFIDCLGEGKLRADRSSPSGILVNEDALTKLGEAAGATNERAAAINYCVNKRYVNRRTGEVLTVMKPGDVRDFIFAADLLFVRPVSRNADDDLHEFRTWKLMRENGGVMGRIGMPERASGPAAGTVEVSTREIAGLKEALEKHVKKAITWNAADLVRSGPPQGPSLTEDEAAALAKSAASARAKQLAWVSNEQRAQLEKIFGSDWRRKLAEDLEKRWANWQDHPAEHKTAWLADLIASGAL